jgi:hypothetical protein
MLSERTGVTAEDVRIELQALDEAWIKHRKAENKEHLSKRRKLLRLLEVLEDEEKEEKDVAITE